MDIRPSRLGLETKFRFGAVSTNLTSRVKEEICVQAPHSFFETVEYNLFQATLLILFVAGLMRILKSELAWLSEYLAKFAALIMAWFSQRRL